MLKNQTVKINLGNDKFLVVSIDTYDNQKVELDDVSLWITDTKNNFIQDIVTVTPVRKFNNKNMTLETDNSKNSSMFYSLSIPKLTKLSLCYQPTKLRGCSESS